MSTTPSTGSPAARSFDHHDQALAGRIHETYAAIRADSPVAWSERHGGFWLVSGWQAAHDIARDAEAFSSSVGLIPNPLGDHVLIPISLDPPEHSKYRSLLQRWFTPTRVGGFQAYTRQRCVALLEGLGQRVDLAEDYAGPLPLDVILTVIGVPGRDMEPVAAGVRATIDAGAEAVPDLSALERAFGYLVGQLIPELRTHPGDDLVSFLIASDIDGEPLADETIASIAFNIVGAGFDTTYKTLASAIAFLAQHPNQQDELRRSADLSPAVEEFLRLFGPVSVGRVATRDIDYAGECIHAGDSVLLAFPAAGRDPAVFADPDAPDFHRQPNKHLSFGTGIHRCLGMHLARMELLVALEELFRATSWFEAEPGASPVYAQSQVSGATSVPVVVTK